MNEFQLIDKYFKPLTKSHEAAQNLSDDTARISLKFDEELIISKDIFVEDVHFLRSDGGFKIATKLLRTNLSDLASSGARPLYYMLGFSKNKNLDQKFLSDFARGLKMTQNEFNLCLIGGDTVKSDKLFFSITIFGSKKKGNNLLRNQAKEGDLIFVSGTIGDAFLGLKGSKNKFLQNRHFFPTPRIELGKKLLEKKLSECAIDVSDGLLSDLNHICQSSKLDAEIKLDLIPLSLPTKKALKKNPEINILDLISAGDDYELIFAANPNNKQKILRLSEALNLDLTCIGNFRKTTKKNFSIILRDQRNQKVSIKKLGYEH